MVAPRRVIFKTSKASVRPYLPLLADSVILLTKFCLNVGLESGPLISWGSRVSLQALKTGSMSRKSVNITLSNAHPRKVTENPRVMCWSKSLGERDFLSQTLAYRETETFCRKVDNSLHSTACVPRELYSKILSKMRNMSIS